MKKKSLAPLRTGLAIGLLLLAGSVGAGAQEPARTDSTTVRPTDGTARSVPMSLPEGSSEGKALPVTGGQAETGQAAAGSDSLRLTTEVARLPRPREPRDMSLWRPDPKRALWLALVIPGGGQIYNRKYWKLPLVYGGFIGCLYAMNWNNTMYKDYSQAYLDLMDSDPGTQSYNQFLHLGTQITPENSERYKKIFKQRKDRFRRWRDMSFFVMMGVYALSVIDAYVDAELSEFDISKDLSLRLEPTVMSDHARCSSLGSSSLGLQCSLSF